MQNSRLLTPKTDPLVRSIAEWFVARPATAAQFVASYWPFPPAPRNTIRVPGNRVVRRVIPTTGIHSHRALTGWHGHNVRFIASQHEHRFFYLSYNSFRNVEVRLSRLSVGRFKAQLVRVQSPMLP